MSNPTMTCPYCGDSGTPQWFVSHSHPNPFATEEEKPMDDIDREAPEDDAFPRYSAYAQRLKLQRRYALLQAATLILYSPDFRYPQHKTPYLAAIDYAEEMLAEIERRDQ